MSNAILSLILGGMLVLSVITATLTSDAHAKILPNSRADLVVGIDTSGGEIVHEDGSITYERKFATEGNSVEYIYLVMQSS